MQKIFGITRKRVAGISALSLAAGVLIAGSFQTSANAALSSAPVKLVVQYETGSSGQVIWPAVASAFTKKYPNVTIEFSTVTNAAKAGPNLQVLIADGAPDIGLVPLNSSVYTNMVAGKQLVDLSEIFEVINEQPDKAVYVVKHTYEPRDDIKYLNTRDFIDKDKYEEVELHNGEKVKIWKEYKWDDLKDAIEKDREHGVIVSGDYFPKDKLSKLKIDLHLHIKLAKQNLILNRLKHIHSQNEENKKKYYSDETETLIINQIIFPEYLDILQQSHINKFINANEYYELTENQYNDKLTDKIFDEIIKHIIEFLKNKNLDKYIV